MALKNGQFLVGRFKIISPLGSENSPTIFKALDTELRTHVAIKVLASSRCSEHVIEALQQQVKQVKAINHPNVALIHELYFEHELVFYSMQLSEGESLFSRLRNAISPNEANLWIGQLLDVAEVFHGSGCLLGEIRLDKIIVDTHNNIHLMDFGTGPSALYSGQSFALQQFDASEMSEGRNPNVKSDVFSLGKVIELLLQCIDGDKMDKEEVKKRKFVLAVVKNMTHTSAQARISLADCKQQILVQSEASVRRRRTKWAVLATVSVIGLLVYLTSGRTNESTIVAEQIAIVADARLPILQNLAVALDSPLKAFPSLSVLDSSNVIDISANLSLKPSINLNDRRRLAELLNTPYLLVLASKTVSETTYVISATLREMPSDRMIFDIKHDVVISNMPEDLSRLSQKLINQIQKWNNDAVQLPNYTLFIKHALLNTRSVSLNLPTLQQKAPNFPEVWLYSAQQSLKENQVEQAIEYLNRLLGMQFDVSYWRLKGEWLRASLDVDSDQSAQRLAQLSMALNKHYPSRYSDIVEQAELSLNRENLLEAEMFLQNARLLQPNSGSVLHAIGRVQMLNGNVQGAIDNALKLAVMAFRLQADVVSESNAMVTMGEANMMLGQANTAQQFFSDAFELLKDDIWSQEREKLRVRLSNLGVELTVQADL